VFEAPAETIAEMERSLDIPEDVRRYLVTRAVKPVRARRDAAPDEGEEADTDLPPVEDEELDDVIVEQIDESETEAAPAAID